MTTATPSVPLHGGVVVGFALALAMTPFLAALGDGEAAPTELLLARVAGEGSPGDFVGYGTVLHLAYGTAAGAVLAALEPQYFVGWPKFDPLWETVRAGAENGLVFGALLTLVGAALLRGALDLRLRPRRVGVLLAFNLVYGASLGAALAYLYLRW